MLEAFLERDPTFDGLFVAAVKTTGVFCRATCPARKPDAQNVEFFASPQEAIEAGYRACRRCRPLAHSGEAPDWIHPLLEVLEETPERRWRDADLREMDLSPERVRRWFRGNLGMTFHEYSRAMRLGSALERIEGGGNVTDSAFATGWDSLSGFQEAFQRRFGTSPSDARHRPRMTVTPIPTPLGVMIAVSSDDHVHLLEFGDRRRMEVRLERVKRGVRERLGASRTRADPLFVPGRTAVLDQLAEELEAYFAGSGRRFTVVLRPIGTEFQRAVWTALLEIPFGATWSYGEVARAIGRPRAVRAVGRAVGDNPLGIVVPCHRVIGADGRLTGYAAGLWRKRRLLALEKGPVPEPPGEASTAHTDAAASSPEDPRSKTKPSGSRGGNTSGTLPLA